MLFHCSIISSALLAFQIGGVRAYLVSPDGTAAPGTISTCSDWVQALYALTCALIEEYFEITAANFELWVNIRLLYSFYYYLSLCVCVYIS